MDLFWTKIVCAVLSVTLSLLFGFLPLSLRGGRCAITIDPADPNYKKSRRGNQILSFLLNFSGGVLIANCFCHWLPEVREGESTGVGIAVVQRHIDVSSSSACRYRGARH